VRADISVSDEYETSPARSETSPNLSETSPARREISLARSETSPNLSETSPNEPNERTLQPTTIVFSAYKLLILLHAALIASVQLLACISKTYTDNVD